MKLLYFLLIFLCPHLLKRDYVGEHMIVSLPHVIVSIHAVLVQIVLLFPTAVALVLLQLK